jgi:hypothetical protein
MAHQMLYDLLVVQDKRQLKHLVVKALPVFAAPSGTKQHLVDVIMKALREDDMIEGIYSSILSCFGVEYLKTWIRSHAKGGARGAKTKIELISVFLVLDRPADGVDAADMPMPPPLMQLVPRDEQIKNVKRLRKSWLKGAKFLHRKKKSKLMLTVIRNAIEACPEITIAQLQDKVHEHVSLDVTAAYLFFHKMLIKELSDMTFTKRQGHWYAAKKKRKRRRRPVMQETECIRCADQWREMSQMFSADLESFESRRIWL